MFSSFPSSTELRVSSDLKTLKTRFKIIKMKFTDSPVVELSVRDKLLSIQQDNGSMHVGTSVWPCSLVLVKFAERWSPLSSSSASIDNPYADLLNFTGKRGIELGTGCGVAGMGFYLLGLHDVVLTDIAPVMPALKRNLKRNKQVLGKNLKTSVLYWGKEDQLKTLKPPFDVVVATDVVYLVDNVGSLVDTMKDLVKDDGVILLGYQLRCPDADKKFWEICVGVFQVERVRKEDLHEEYGFEETDVYVLRKNVAAREQPAAGEASEKVGDPQK